MAFACLIMMTLVIPASLRMEPRVGSLISRIEVRDDGDDGDERSAEEADGRWRLGRGAAYLVREIGVRVDSARSKF